MVVGIVGILKAGAAYIPIDGGVATDSTLQHVLVDSSCNAVVCLPQFRHRIPDNTLYTVLDLEELQQHSHDTECSSVGDEVLLGDGAYVIYTSGVHYSSPRRYNSQRVHAGTTGKPKGVDVTHRNVTNCEYKLPAFA
jgi:non-ribosomal peptide synthetase component F